MHGSLISIDCSLFRQSPSVSIAFLHYRTFCHGGRYVLLHRQCLGSFKSEVNINIITCTRTRISCCNVHQKREFSLFWGFKCRTKRFRMVKHSVMIDYWFCYHNINSFLIEKFIDILLCEWKFFPPKGVLGLARSLDFSTRHARLHLERVL